jgi:histone acetyltransferase 1
LARVEEDATNFKPSGQLIYSYIRPSPLQTGKGKGAVQIQNLDLESEDAVVFEVYHVSVDFLFFRELFTSMQDNMEYAGLQRIPSENAALCPPIY